MHNYCVYLLNEQKKISKVTWVRGDSLDEVIAQVSSELQETTCEIWDGTHCLATVASPSSPRHPAG